MDLQLTVHPSSVAGPGGYGRGQEGYGGPGERLNSNNDYNDGDRYNSGNNEGGYGGGNGRHGHSSGTSYGGVPGGDDDYSSAAHVAAQHAGDSGDSNLFSSALSMLSGHKAQQGDVDEDEAVRHHQQFYGGASQPHPASSGSMGSAAAMQALKMFNQGGSSSGNGGKSQNDFIGLAMSQAAKLFGMYINHDLQGKLLMFSQTSKALKATSTNKLRSRMPYPRPLRWLSRCT